MAQGQSGDRSELYFVFIIWVYCVLSLGAHLLEFPLVGGGWGQNLTKHYLTYIGTKHQSKKRKEKKRSTWWRLGYRFRQWDFHEKWNKLAQNFDNWVGEWRSPSAKVMSFCNSEGFSIYCRNPEDYQKTEKWLLLVECGKRAQAQNLLLTNRFIDRPVKVSIHKTSNSSRGVIRCRDLANMSEVEIRDELKDQGVVGVNRVTLRKERKVIPTNTLFLTFGSPDLLKRRLQSAI